MLTTGHSLGQAASIPLKNAWLSPEQPLLGSRSLAVPFDHSASIFKRQLGYCIKTSA